MTKEPYIAGLGCLILAHLSESRVWGTIWVVLAIYFFILTIVNGNKDA